MTTIIKRLWQDDRGFVVSTELILLATIVVIGLLVGLVVWRDAIVQELGDTGAAIGQLNQSYSIEVQENEDKEIFIKGDFVVIERDFGCVEMQASFPNFEYIDASDVCDGQDQEGQPPAGITISDPPKNEGN